MSQDVEPSSPRPPRRLGLVSAVSLVVASMIGTGIFTTSGFLVRDLASLSAVLIAWLVGGFVALAGALSYAELVGMFPENGGEYQLLERIYHPAVGFVAGWISLIVGFSAPIAAAALAFGEYLQAVAPAIPAQLSAVTLIFAFTALNVAHVRASGVAQNLLAALQVVLILVFIAAGLTTGDLSRITEGSTSTSAALLSPAFAVGLVYVSFGYSGWNASAYVAGEIERPRTNLPIALATGTLLVTLLYVGLNVVFLAGAPASELAGQVDIAHIAAVTLFGDTAGIFVTILISIGLAASVAAMILSGARIYEAMGLRHKRLSFLNRRTATGGPIYATLLQSTLAIIMTLTASFETLLVYVGFTLALSTGLTVAGVYILRRREPEHPRPYRVTGYPITPLLFLLLVGWTITHTLQQRAAAAAAGLITIATGLAAYYLLRDRR